MPKYEYISKVSGNGYLATTFVQSFTNYREASLKFYLIKFITLI